MCFVTTTKRLLLTRTTMSALQRSIPPRFFELYDSGLKLYLAGRWAQALEVLEEVLVVRFVLALVSDRQTRQTGSVKRVVVMLRLVVRPKWQRWAGWLRVFRRNYVGHLQCCSTRKKGLAGSLSPRRLCIAWREYAHGVSSWMVIGRR
jgi:hypothetical protein